MPISSKSPQPAEIPTQSEITQQEVADIKRLLGLDVNRLAIGDNIEGSVSVGTRWTNPFPSDYTINGVNVIEFANVSTSIVVGTQTGT